MKKYINIKIGIITCTLFSIIACKDSIEGINTDPLTANIIDPGLLMPEILLGGISNNRTIEMSPINMQAQHWSAIVVADPFTNPERYTVLPNTTTNIWLNQFTTALQNLLQIKELTLNNNPDALNIIGQAETLEALSYLNLTQVFGSIPFSQALQADEFPNPIFDNQEEVLRGIVDLCNAATNNLVTDTEIITSSDLIFEGDKLSWIRFANSIKLKALMLIANVDPSSVTTELQITSTQPLITGVNQIAKLDYTTDAGNENPIWKTIDQFSGGQNVFWGAASTLVNMMNANSDPRRIVYFDDVSGTYVGQDQGMFSPVGISRVSLNIIRPEMPDIYIHPSEINFYLAEAALKGWITGDANTHYQAGIQASLDSYDNYPQPIDNANKTAFMSSPRGSITGDSFDAALLKIHEEIYISNFTRGLEAWTNIRRNNVPDFQLPVAAALNTLIRRYHVPLSEVTSNPNAPILPTLDTPMWFENE
ncbi:MAG: SusD/RagB family nutrient-binding outer membrane lipoprotein [Flavobacteriaceae bacterium]|nr:SusD/RagB family nutrient-binding outer membrane lipoprotein [Flavobacteriaceae bacterium]